MMPRNAEEAQDWRDQSEGYWSRAKTKQAVEIKATAKVRAVRASVELPPEVAESCDLLDERARRAEEHAAECKARADAAVVEAELAMKHAANMRENAILQRRAAMNVAMKAQKVAALEALKAKLEEELAALNAG